MASQALHLLLPGRHTDPIYDAEVNEYSNPGSRLLNLLNDLDQQWRKNGANSVGYDVLRSTWPGAGSTAEFAHWLGDAFALPHDVFDAIERTRVPAVSFALDGLEAIATGFDESLLLQNRKVNDWLNVVNLTKLAGIAEALDQVDLARERVLPAELLDALRSHIDALVDEFVASDSLPSELRAFCIDSLNSVRTALINYRLKGASRLAHELDTAVGRWHREGFEAPSADEGAGLVDRLLKVFATAALAVGFAANSKTIVTDPVLPWHDVEPIEVIIQLLPPDEIPEIENRILGELMPADPRQVADHPSTGGTDDASQPESGPR